MYKLRKKLSLVLAFIIAFTTITIPVVVKAEDNVKITILATSDLHGKIYPWEYATDLSQEWGLAKLATLIKEERKADPNLILIDNGDTIESNMINLFNDEEIHPMIKALNELKYDAWSLGNHEFNFGLDVLNKAIKGFNGDVISANILKTDDKTNFVKPYIVKEVKGIKVGILGLISPHIKRWEASTPEHFKNLDFVDPLSTAKKYVDILKNEEKVDIIIGAFHIGKTSENYDPNLIDSIEKIAEEVKGIDVIIGGHAHDTLGAKDKQVVIGKTIILEPASDGKFLGKAVIEIAKNKDGIVVIDKTTDLLSVTKVDPDATLLDDMKYVDKRSKEEAYKVVGNATGDFVPTDTVLGIPEAQIKPTALLELINKVQMFYTKADVSAAALFDTRSNLTKGELQFKDVALIYKYSNTLQAHKISGENLKKYMEWSASYYNTQQLGDITVSFNKDIRAYNYDMFFGVDYEIDITKPAGERIINPTILGKPIDDNKEYILAINNYRVGTLQSLKLLPEDGNKSITFDSTTLSTPEMQRLIQKYIQEELKGTAVPTLKENWKLKKTDTKDLVGYEETIKLINEGFLKLPLSEDGRTPNIKSINVLEKITNDEKNEILKNVGFIITTDKTDISKGEFYKLVYDKKYNIISKPEVDEIKEEKKETVVVTPEEIKNDTDENIVNNKNAEVTNSEISYTVQAGDTLSKIGKKYNVDYMEIVKINKISNPNLITVGQKLIIPVK